MFYFPCKQATTNRNPFLSSTPHLEILIFDVLKRMTGLNYYTFIYVRIRTLPEFKDLHYRQCSPLAFPTPPGTSL